MSGQISTVAFRLAERLIRPVAEADRDRARGHLLDWIACAVGGAVEPGTREPRALAALEGAGPCRVIGGRRAGPLAAALANGPAGAVLEMDDVDRRGLLHPGPVVAPAALAVAEAAGVDDGAALLDAIVRGYEAMIRVGRAAGAGHYRHFHTTGTCGAFGAAAAGASLLGLATTQTAWALGNAGQQAAGLWQARHEPVFTKSFHDGRAAANGVAAALLAADGYAGPLSIFEGPQGFFAAMCPGSDPADLLAVNDRWAIHDVSFKPYAACRHAHAAIDCVLDLRARCAGHDLRTLEIASYADALTFCDRPAPTTPGEAKFSLQHAAAVAWRSGTAGLEQFTAEAIADPAMVALRARVSAQEAPAITARYPARFGALVKVTLADGRVLEAETTDAWGDPEKPVTALDLEAKARALFTWGGLSPSEGQTLIDAVDRLGRGGAVAALSAALPGLDA